MSSRLLAQLIGRGCSERSAVIAPGREGRLHATAGSPSVALAPASVVRMITELLVLSAVLLLQHKVHAFLAVCAVCLVCGVIRRRASGDGSSFVRAAGRDLFRGLVACSRVLLASTFVVIAACGFVAGQWDGWVVAVVAWVAVWAAWASLTIGQQQKDAEAASH